MIEARIICDSMSPHGHRLTTFELRYPKFIHGEFMTHRVFSRNASSSRAVPTAKLLDEVRSDASRAAPVFWGKNQPGMQAAEELEGYPEHPKLGDSYRSPKMEVQIAWSRAAMNAAHEAEQMLKWGAHKQIANRLLEPFSHIKVVVTATEYMNFFGLRLDGGAQPEMRALAEAMWRAYGESRPATTSPGCWHLPYLDHQDEERAFRRSCATGHPDSLDRTEMDMLCCRISTARCARVSYATHEDPSRKPTFEEDLALYDRLVGAQPLHASPAEHQATPDDMYSDMWLNRWQHGNFTGWRQYRKMLPGEEVAPLPEGYR